MFGEDDEGEMSLDGPRIEDIGRTKGGPFREAPSAHKGRGVVYDLWDIHERGLEDGKAIEETCAHGAGARPCVEYLSVELHYPKKGAISPAFVRATASMA